MSIEHDLSGITSVAYRFKHTRDRSNKFSWWICRL